VVVMVVVVMVVVMVVVVVVVVVDSGCVGRGVWWYDGRYLAGCAGKDPSQMFMRRSSKLSPQG
jgi:hypothetical protein